MRRVLLVLLALIRLNEEWLVALPVVVFCLAALATPLLGLHDEIDLVELLPVEVGLFARRLEILALLLLVVVQRLEVLGHLYAAGGRQPANVAV